MIGMDNWIWDNVIQVFCWDTLALVIIAIYFDAMALAIVEIYCKVMKFMDDECLCASALDCINGEEQKLTL